MNKTNINVSKLINELDGPYKAHLKLKKCGYDISESGVRKWVKRNSIPAHRLIEVIDTLQRIKYSPPPMSKFIESTEESESS
ncbi:hypothetical protein MTBPR1_30033 [Candidatus Terasakiella magnetica]|uniref:Uncharacterized protein n=1 Tax=Candidatus Terasakiella magnetica TaxID=1867952 RepID=A0A1C3RHB5_9PROT|nr:hypothetical protein [Candidatus Terasakiella magnetica]SCA56663.1 hypothetical protein MTBPR1_30033 [Candidatus Terasakiella magnetica]